MSKKDKMISFHCLSEEHKALARQYAVIMGYRCVIKDNQRVAVLIDQKGNRGLLTSKDGVLHYYWKGVFEKIEITIPQEEVKTLEVLTFNMKHLGQGMNRILGKIFGVQGLGDFKKRGVYAD